MLFRKLKQQKNNFINIQLVIYYGAVIREDQRFIILLLCVFVERSFFYYISKTK